MATNKSENKTNESILLVDDTIENLRLLAGMLSHRGLDVRPVSSAHDALQAIEHDPPALILLDISMPQMDGLELCAQLKSTPAYRDIPVVFLTALAETSHKVKGFAAGGADYITKPFQIDEVLARVNNHLALRRARVALAENLERLQQLERMRDDLVHMIVHDMRSPLAVMIANLGLMRTRCDGDLAEMLDDVHHAANGLNRMANTLLDVSRLEEGKMPLDLSLCDLSTLAAEVRDSLASLDAARYIGLSVPGSIYITCDAGLVRRVLENLVSNAIKHTPTGGRLQIEIEAREDRARVAVRDEGPGIDPSFRDMIFDKFATATARNGRGYHSAGLGLAFCKLAVQAHGGAIFVETSSPRGSVFTFELPNSEGTPLTS